MAAKPKANDPITPELMRHLHAGFRTHGIEGDSMVHDYLSLVLGRDVESRKTLTVGEARTAIADLDQAERHPTPHGLAQLRRPFPDEAVGKLPRSLCQVCSKNSGICERHPSKFKCDVCGNYHSASSMHLDYVGHADVTARLLEVDPQWTWRAWTPEELMGLPPAMRDAGMWIHLTVLGITRPGFGDADGKKGGNGAKEAIGDALRNAAMRFGVALDLWAKGDREWARTEKDEPNPSADAAATTGGNQTPPPPADGPDDPETGMSPYDVIEQLQGLADQQGMTLEAMTKRWRNEHGGFSVELLYTAPAVELLKLSKAVADYIADQAKTKTDQTAGANA